MITSYIVNNKAHLFATFDVEEDDSRSVTTQNITMIIRTMCVVYVNPGRMFSNIQHE